MTRDAAGRIRALCPLRRQHRLVPSSAGIVRYIVVMAKPIVMHAHSREVQGGRRPQGKLLLQAGRKLGAPWRSDGRGLWLEGLNDVLRVIDEGAGVLTRERIQDVEVRTKD